MRLQDAIGELVGRQLTSVEFVQDYLQFRFDGPCLTTLTLPSLCLFPITITAAHECYADHLVSVIGSVITKVAVRPDELVIGFASSATLLVSLREVDCVGPEAVNYVSNDGLIFVA